MKTIQAFRRAVITLFCGCKYAVPATDDTAGLPGREYFCEKHGLSVVIRRDRRNW